MSDPKLVFSFDLCIASLGFAAVDLDRNELIHMARHLFPAPQEPKTKASLAAKRRGYRSNRRGLERDKTRRNRCRRLLIDAGLVPDGVDPKWFETRQGDADIVVLRHRALSERITDRELARVLLYFCKHRQYIDQGTSGRPSRGYWTGAGGAAGGGAPAGTTESEPRHPSR